MSEFFAVHVASDDECSLNSSGVFGSFKEALQFASTPERKSKGSFLFLHCIYPYVL